MVDDIEKDCEKQTAASFLSALPCPLYRFSWLFPPAHIFAALDPFVFRGLCICRNRPLIADFDGGDSALRDEQSHSSTVHMELLAELGNREIIH